MQSKECEFSRRLDVLDLTLFDAIHTQSTEGDRRSWLAVQRAVRRPSGYVYAEIGSHLGGSLQQHVLDPLCRRIISIDKRPEEVPNGLGGMVRFEANSTDRMLDNLRRVDPAAATRITCYNSDARDIDAGSIPEPPSFCFIDGDHSDAAVLSDFLFCLDVCTPDAAICFHDDWVTYNALGQAMAELRVRGVPFVAYKLAGATFGIFLRNSTAKEDPFIRTCSRPGNSWLRGRRLRASIRRGLSPVARWLPAFVRGQTSHD